jgi:hypothetical protein
VWGGADGLETDGNFFGGQIKMRAGREEKKRDEEGKYFSQPSDYRLFSELSMRRGADV